MAKIKRILICFMLVVVTIGFCACSTVRAMTVTNEDGSIDELVYVTLDSEILDSYGYTESEISDLKSDISSTALSEANSILESFNKKINADLMLNMDMETRSYLLSMKSGLNIIGNVWEDEIYVIGLRFSDVNVYKYYYNITESSTSSSESEEHLLYTKISYYGLNMFVDYGELYEKLNNEFSEKYSEFVGSDSSELLYTYITETRREHSDADYITYMDGKYYHTWVVNADNIDNEITIYYNIANKANCILLCIGLSVAFCLILLIVGLLINRKQKKLNLRNNLQ